MSYVTWLTNPDQTLKDADEAEFRCRCGNTGFKNVGRAKRSLKEKGFAYQCKPCLELKKYESKKKVYSVDFLTQASTLDKTERAIKSHDIVDFVCRCGAEGQRKWTDAQKNNKLYGFWYQCESCRKANLAARSNNETWLANIRAAAQTEAKKETARANGKKRLLIKKLKNIREYWDFGDTDLQNTPGHLDVSGTCKACGTSDTKPLKKFIEAADSQSRGCAACWDALTKSPKYSKFMKFSSRKFWDSDESLSARQRLVDKAPDLRDHYDNWVRENPDKAFSSKAELEVLEWVRSLGFDAKKHRTGGQEIDVFIPELNIGIEYNGLYWHSEVHKDKHYHHDKTEFFKSQGIRVIHVFEHEWRDRQDQVKSFLLSAFGKNSNRVGARKTAMQEVDKTQAKAFLDAYHIQGSCHFDVALGLYVDGILISLATFGRHHRNAGVMVLSRFVTKTEWTVSGGLAKLSRAGFERYGELISWADQRWSVGNGYEKSGWKVKEILKADYFYTDFTDVFSKQSRKKDLVGTPKEVTEHEHALADGLFRVYDCGKIAFVYK